MLSCFSSHNNNRYFQAHARPLRISHFCILKAIKQFEEWFCVIWDVLICVVFIYKPSIQFIRDNPFCMTLDQQHHISIWRYLNYTQGGGFEGLVNPLNLCPPLKRDLPRNPFKVGILAAIRGPGCFCCSWYGSSTWTADIQYQFNLNPDIQRSKDDFLGRAIYFWIASYTFSWYWCIFSLNTHLAWMQVVKQGTVPDSLSLGAAHFEVFRFDVPWCVQQWSCWSLSF